jgi:arabinogalactan endo-1,4-beta-galactosidase
MGAKNKKMEGLLMLTKKWVKRMSIMLAFLIAVTAGAFEGSASNPAQASTHLVKGADVGWLSQLEDQGVVYQDVDGTQKDALQILKDNGIDTIRLRVFVNPPSDFMWEGGGMLGYADKNGVIDMAQRADNLGLDVMIDFHYSDHWADGLKQDKPEAWENYSFSQLKSAVYYHTRDVMQGLADVGIYPKWVQVGNEIRKGMLWPDGKTPNYGNLAQLINEGYYGVKDVSPDSKIIVHIDKGADNGRSREFFDGLMPHNPLFDIIGLSYYPYWDGVDYTQNINSLGNNMNDLVSRYNKDVMITEVGGEAINPTNTVNMLNAVQDKLEAVPNGRGLGLIYWEPQSSQDTTGYNLGAATDVSTNVVRFTSAITAFNSGSSGGGGDSYVKIQNRNSGLYLDGMGRTTDGDNAGQWSNSSSSNQQWVIESAGSYIKIKNRHSGLYLDGMGRTTDGSAVGQWSSGSSHNQQWEQETVGSYVKFRNRATGLYLDGLNHTNNGADSGQWSSSSSYNQQWRIVSP